MAIQVGMAPRPPTASDARARLRGRLAPRPAASRRRASAPCGAAPVPPPRRPASRRSDGPPHGPRSPAPRLPRRAAAARTGLRVLRARRGPARCRRRRARYARAASSALARTAGRASVIQDDKVGLAAPVPVMARIRAYIRRLAGSTAARSSSIGSHRGPKAASTAARRPRCSVSSCSRTTTAARAAGSSESASPSSAAAPDLGLSIVEGGDESGRIPGIRRNRPRSAIARRHHHPLSR